MTIVFFIEIDQVGYVSSFVGAVPCKMSGLPALEAVIVSSWLVSLCKSLVGQKLWIYPYSLRVPVSHGSWGVGGVVDGIEAAGESGAAGSGARGAGRPGESGGAGEGSAVLWEGGGDGDVTRDGGDAGVGGVGEACEGT